MAAILTVDYWLVKKRAYHVYVSISRPRRSSADLFSSAVPSFTTLAVSVRLVSLLPSFVITHSMILADRYEAGFNWRAVVTVVACIAPNLVRRPSLASTYRRSANLLL